MKTRTVALLAASLALVLARSSQAGLTGQPRPTAATVAKINAAVKDITGTGDLGAARPALLLAIEADAASDMTDLLGPILRDSVTYNGVAATLEDAARTKTGSEADFVKYNVAKLYLLRARAAGTGPGKATVLGQAAKIATGLTTGLNTTRDPAAWDLLGDIRAEEGNVDAAAAAYSRITGTTGEGVAAWSQLKQGMLYQRGNRYAQAEEAYQKGVRGLAAGGGSSASPEIAYRLWQGLAGVYVDQGRDGEAADALVRSAKAIKSEPNFRWRTDVAEKLLRRGRAKDVLDYADAALRLTPSDDAIKALRDRARAASGRPVRR